MSSRRIDIDFRFFFIGLSNCLVFSFIGTVILGEIFLIALLFSLIPFLNRNKSFVLQKTPFYFFIWACVWIICQLFTDIYREADNVDTLKSLAQITVLALLILAVLTKLQEKDNFLISYYIGLNISNIILLLFLYPNSLPNTTDVWKFYLGPSISGIILLVIGLLKLNSTKKNFFIISLSFFSLALGARSLSLILLITALSLYISPAKFNMAKVTLVSIIIIPVGLIISDSYREAALDGKFGIQQMQKAEAQYRNGPILFSARSEILYEIAAIKSSPFFGYGSNPRATDRILTNTYLLEEDFGINSEKVTGREQYLKTGRIPQHSMFFGAWLEGGLFAILFWLYTFWKMTEWNFSSRMRTSTSNLDILSKYLYFNFVWAFFFSPLGAGSRMTLATSLGIAFLSYRKSHGMVVD